MIGFMICTAMAVFLSHSAYRRVDDGDYGGAVHAGLLGIGGFIIAAACLVAA